MFCFVLVYALLFKFYACLILSYIFVSSGFISVVFKYKYIEFHLFFPAWSSDIALLYRSILSVLCTACDCLQLVPDMFAPGGVAKTPGTSDVQNTNEDLVCKLYMYI